MPTKSELIEINDQLMVEVQNLRESNASLARNCHELQKKVELTEEELARLNRRYQSFADYVKRLRAWMLTRHTSEHDED